MCKFIEKFKKLFSKKKQVVFAKERFHGRLFGFSWVVLEKRDPNFDGVKLKSENSILIVLKAMSFMNTEEKDVVNKIMDLMKTDKSLINQNEYLIGALEGKLILYNDLSPQLLLEEKEIK